MDKMKNAKTIYKNEKIISTTNMLNGKIDRNSHIDSNHVKDKIKNIKQNKTKTQNRKKKIDFSN